MTAFLLSRRPCLVTVLLLSLVSFLHPRLLRVVLAQNDTSSTINLVIRTDRLTSLAMADVTLSYLVIDSSVAFTSTLGNGPTNLALVTDDAVDFAITSQGLTTTQALAAPAVTMYPFLCTGVVPIYRLDGIASANLPLVLSREVLVQIYLGNITMWNDAAIANINRALSMPATPIVVVFHNESTTLNEIFTRALDKFDPLWSTVSSVDVDPVWPIGSYHDYMGAAGPTAVAAAVVSRDGTIGYAALSVALQMSTQYAQMRNKAGMTVVANSESITYAAVELGTQTQARPTSDIDLTDGSGSSVWPICALSYVLVDYVNSRSTCHARAAIVNFWLWFYQSDIVSGLVETRQYARVPDIVMTSLNVIDRLETEVLCRGSPAYQAAASPIRLRSVPPSVTFTCTLFSHIYVDPDSTVTWQVTTLPDQVIFDQLTNAEIDIGVIIPENVDSVALTAARASGEFALVPVYIVAYTFMYNYQLTETVNIQGYTLRLDVRTMGLIWYGCLLYWNDPLMLELNPWLLPLIGNTTLVPIQSVVGCGSQDVALSPVGSSLYTFIADWQAQHNDSLLASCMTNYTTPRTDLVGGVSTLAEATAACIDQPHLFTQFAQSEAAVPSLVEGSIGSMGYFQADNDATFGVPVLSYTRGGVTVDTVPNLDGLRSCAYDTYDPVAMYFNLEQTTNSSCYPWHSQVMSMVRTRYTSSATDTSSCQRGLDSLQYLYWLLTQRQVDTLVNSVDILRTSSIEPAYLAAFIAKLDAVTCDGTTLLITLPTIWVLSTGVAGFAQALCAIGLVLCFIVAALVVHHRTHPVIRSASPLFLLMSVSGVMLLFLAGFTLVSPVTTGSCAAFSWLLVLGIQTTFAPLFAKTWRIYRIFGRKKLSVVQISNRKLLLIVLAIIALDVALMVVWQALGALSPITSTVNSTNSSGHLVINEYDQCGIGAGGAKDLFVLLCVEKGVLFVFGALMAFTTRKVSSTFNESSGISFSIYNLLFTVGIIAPIILVISAVGDVLTLLLVFALLWIAYFTAGILFGPKLMHIYSHTPVEGMQNNSIQASSGDSSSGFQFLSLAALSTLPVLQSYLFALQKHTGQVESKIAEVKRKQSGGSLSTNGNPPHRRTMSMSTNAESKKTAGQGPTRQSIASVAPSNERAILGSTNHAAESDDSFNRSQTTRSASPSAAGISGLLKSAEKRRSSAGGANGLVIAGDSSAAATIMKYPSSRASPMPRSSSSSSSEVNAPEEAEV